MPRRARAKSATRQTRDIMGNSHSNAVTPLIFVLSPGVDPTASLQQLAVIKGQTDKFHSVALGQGQVGGPTPPLRRRKARAAAQSINQSVAERLLNGRLAGAACLPGAGQLWVVHHSCK